MAEIKWTARETFACALCWAGFHGPENRTDTPEQYWLSITERVRADYRADASKRLVVATARGEAVSILPWPSLPPSQQEAIIAAVGLKSVSRVYKIFGAIRGVFLAEVRSNAR